MLGRITKGQIRTALAFIGGVLVATGEWTLTDITSLVRDIETASGIISTVIAAIWSATDKKAGEQAGA